MLGFQTMFAAETIDSVQNKEISDNKKLTFATRIQARAAAGQVNSAYASNNDWDAVDFNFYQIRMGLNYQGAKWYGMKVDIKAENLLTSGAASKSSIQEANIWFKPGFWNSTIKFGQFKLPFNREQNTSSARLMVPERALSTVNTLQQQDIGVFWSFMPFGNIFEFSLAVTNGDGSGQEGEGLKSVEASTAGEKTSPLYALRLQWNPFGGMIQNGTDVGWINGVEIFQNSRLLSIGVGAIYTENNERENGGFVTNKELSGVSADATFFIKGFYSNAEYTIFAGPSAPKNYQSFAVSIGYNIKLSNVFLMPMLRYNYLESDIGNDGTIDDNEKLTDIWLGLNYYPDKHNMKMQLFYRLRQDGSGVDIGKDELTLQVQVDL